MVKRTIPSDVAKRCKTEQLKQAYVSGDAVYDIDYLRELFGFNILMVTEYQRHAIATVNGLNKDNYHACLASMPFGSVYMAIELCDADTAHFYGLQLQYV